MSFCHVSAPGYEHVGIFEVGRVVKGVDPETNLVNERKMLCVTLFSKTAALEELYLRMRDIVAVLADDIKHREVTFEKREPTHSWQHPKNLNAVICGGKEIGEIGLIHPSIVKKIDKKCAIVYAEIDVADFAELDSLGIKYDEPSKYPEMEVDLTFRTAFFAPIGATLKNIGSPLVKNVSVADIYDDEKGRALTVRIVFSDKEKTLTRDEVNEVVNELIEKLAKIGVALKQ